MIVALALFRRFWFVLPIALLVWVWRVDSLRARHLRDLTAERAASALFAERVRSKSEEIVRKATENARRIETAQTQIQQEADHEIRSRIAAYAASVRAQTSGKSAGRGGNQMPGAANSARDTAGAGQETELVADRLVCTEAIVKSEGWRDWFRSISTIDRGQ